jgi:hypothetical protein
MRRNLALALFLGFVTTIVLAQSRLTGKWETDRPTDPLSATGNHRNQSVQLEVAIEGDKASGTLNLGGLGGTFYVFHDGKVTGNKVQFRPDSDPTLPIWTIEIVDDNTVMLYHEGLPLFGSNVLDLMSVLGRTSQPVPPGPVAVSGSPVPISIRGSIQDQSKARIPGVTVTATNVDTSAKLATTSNDAGVYGFSGLIPGRYTLTASLSGFNPTTISGLNIGDTEVVQDLTLEFPTQRPQTTPTAASCGGNSLIWCALLHRAK